MIRAVVFDMDGVLVDSEPLHLRALQITFASLGVMITKAGCQENMGRSTMEFLKTVIRDHDIKLSPESVYAEHKRRLTQLYRKRVQPMKGAFELVVRLQEKGIDLALASSSDHELIEVVIRKYSLASVFKTVVSGEDVVQSKPHPAIFLEAAQRLGFDPSECLAIEDSGAGVQAALTAGMGCVGFRSPHSPNQDFTGVDTITDDLSTLRIDNLAPGFSTG